MWQTFWDLFESAIHKSTYMDGAEKFNYLKSQLVGEALHAIDGLHVPLTNNNYIRAVELLTERFGQPHKIINAHMQALLDLPCPANQLTSFQNFHDNFEAHIRGLESLGKSHDAYGDLLVPIIHGKLTEELQRNLVREHGNCGWSLKQLRDAIVKEISILEAGEPHPRAGLESSNFNHASQHTSSAASFLTSSTSNKSFRSKGNQFAVNRAQSAQPTCKFCSKSHSTNNCNVVTSHDERIAIIRQRNLCFNCLNSHRVVNCTSKNCCIICKRKHHTSICNNDKQTTSKQEVVQLSETIVKSPTVHATLTPSVSAATKFQKSSATLLKMAVARVSSTTKITEANILFDEGARRSFISSQLAKKLCLEIDNTEKIYFSTFGGDASSVQHVDITTVYLIATSGERIPIKTIIVPTIAMPLQNRVTTDISNMPHLRGLKLAHPVNSDERFEISLLIGVDYYWDIVESEIIRGEGPTAAKIGYLLSGPIPQFTSSFCQTSILHVITPHADGDEVLQKFWTLESLGIQPSEDNDSYQAFLANYQDKSMRYENGQYFAKLPWKDDHPPLPPLFRVGLDKWYAD